MLYLFHFDYPTFTNLCLQRLTRSAISTTRHAYPHSLSYQASNLICFPKHSNDKPSIIADFSLPIKSLETKGSSVKAIYRFIIFDALKICFTSLIEGVVRIVSVISAKDTSATGTLNE